MSRPISILLLAVMLLTACSGTKYVPEGEYLVDKVKVVNDDKGQDINTMSLRSYVRQVGNSRWLSSVKIPLATYSLSGRDTTRWVNRTLRAMGEPPQLFDTAAMQASIQSLRGQLQNMGYLRATVDAATQKKGKRIHTTYHLHPGTLYRLRHVGYEIQDTALARVIRSAAPEKQGLAPGMAFTTDNLDSERSRITRFLTSRGYYRFNKDFVTYRADSVPGTADIDLTVLVRDYQNAQVSHAPHPVYTIGQVSFLSGNREDSTIHLRPQALRHNTFLAGGELYSSVDLQNTYRHFARLGAVRYTNISFRERQDEPVLDCDIQVSTNKPSTISFQPEGTNTAGDLGAAATLSYQNRNLFRGSENLSVELRGAYEAIRGLEGYKNSNFLEYSIGTRLTFPRFIAPFLSGSTRSLVNATSEVAMLYDLQNRPEFHRRVLTIGWKYKWSNPRHHDSYLLDVVDLNLISMPWVSETFRREYLEGTTSRNSILRYNYENLFIMKTGFGYSYNNGVIALKANIETSGNLLHLIAGTFHIHQNREGQYTILDIAYAQYARGTFDFTRNLRLAYNNQLVFHVGLGIAYPYGNSHILPFEKRYFSGGANSVRGWSVRSLGPGRFAGSDGRIDFINQTGDMKLDVNLEYRAHMFWKFYGALFADAGNIWTIREYQEQPGGQFRLTEFWKQLAASYGLGIRLNFDFFIVRFDMGMKAVNPAYQGTRDQFPVIRPRLSRDFAFHFAVGLPF